MGAPFWTFCLLFLFIVIIPSGSAQEDDDDEEDEYDYDYDYDYDEDEETTPAPTTTPRPTRRQYDPRSRDRQTDPHRRYQPDPRSRSQTDRRTRTQPDRRTDPRTRTQPDRRTDPRTRTQPDPRTRTQPDRRTDPRTRTQPDPRTDPRTRTQPDPRTRTQPDPRTRTQPDRRTDPRTRTQPDRRIDSRTRTQPDPRTRTQPDPRIDPRIRHQTDSRTGNQPDQRGNLDECGCPRDVESQLNSLDTYVKSTTSDNSELRARLDKMEQKMSDLNDLVQRLEEESKKWKSSLRFPGLTVIENPTSLALSSEQVSDETYKDCQNAWDRGQYQRGVYNIRPDGSPYSSLAFCQDGWTIIQRRFDGSGNFNRDFLDYIKGFGNFSGEFWMGLETIHLLTNQEPTTLRIDMESWTGKFYFAVYSNFTVSDELNDYRLQYIKKTAGNSEDGLVYNRGMKFSSRDKDRDGWRGGNCARHYRSGFWLDRCGSDLNRDPSKGLYGGTKWGTRIMKSSLMKIKPTRSLSNDELRLLPDGNQRRGSRRRN